MELSLHPSSIQVDLSMTDDISKLERTLGIASRVLTVTDEGIVTVLLGQDWNEGISLQMTDSSGLDESLTVKETTKSVQ